MAISVTTIGTNANTSGATVAVTVGVGGVPAGALICVAVCDRSSSAPAGSVADSALNTYAALVGANLNNISTNGFGRIFYAFNVAALVNTNTITYTKAASGARASISAFYATGVQTSSDPSDTAASATAFGSSTTPSVTSGTPAAAGDLFVAAVMSDGTTGTFTQDTGRGWATPFNEATSGTANTDARADGGNQVNAGTGTETYAPTYSVGHPWAALVCAFKAAPAPGGLGALLSGVRSMIIGGGMVLASTALLIGIIW